MSARHLFQIAHLTWSWFLPTSQYQMAHLRVEHSRDGSLGAQDVRPPPGMPRHHEASLRRGMSPWNFLVSGTKKFMLHMPIWILWAYESNRQVSKLLVQHDQSCDANNDHHANKTDRSNDNGMYHRMNVPSTILFSHSMIFSAKQYQPLTNHG